MKDSIDNASDYAKDAGFKEMLATLADGFALLGGETIELSEEEKLAAHSRRVHGNDEQRH